MKGLKTVVNRVLRRFGYRMLKIDRLALDESFFYRRLRMTDDFFFVQIGANDGKMDDPIHDFVLKNRRLLRGIVVEPLPDVFAELEHTYRHCPTITPVNVAIHATEEEMVLHRVDPAKIRGLPVWAKGIASFDPNHHARIGIPTDCIIKERVRCVPLDRLLLEHGVTKIDLLQIDTEGHDAAIISAIDFDALTPCMIRFEHGVPDGTTTREAFDEALHSLHENGYAVVVGEYDALAYQPDCLLRF